jgi:hypothetical protein
MAVTKESVDLYDLLLAAPGVERDIKLNALIKGSDALLVVIALEHCLASSDANNPFTRILKDEDRTRLRELISVILQKTGTQSFYETLKKKLGAGA